MRELLSSVPDWLIPSAPKHVVVAYLADEDAAKMPAYQLTGRRHSVSDGGILVDIGFPVEAQEFPDVEDELAFVGHLEIPTWCSKTDPGAST